ncbi:MAG TPA: acetyl-CoA carboxylase biotin carboxyl carrier protein subunit [Polyangia bacterium]
MLTQRESQVPVATAVRAHIAGTVWKLVVSFDDEVEEGQTVAVLESMKMEMPVEAPVAGRVTAIHVAPGRFVEEGEALMELG